MVGMALREFMVATFCAAGLLVPPCLEPIWRSTDAVVVEPPFSNTISNAEEVGSVFTQADKETTADERPSLAEPPQRYVKRLRY